MLPPQLLHTKSAQTDKLYDFFMCYDFQGSLNASFEDSLFTAKALMQILLFGVPKSSDVWISLYKQGPPLFTSNLRFQCD